MAQKRQSNGLEKMPKISIITPAYIDTNAKLQWLREMVDSVMLQSFYDWELVIVDDNSPINPVIEETDRRVRIFRMANHCGPSIARNTAVAISDGEALLPIDADDLLPTDNVLEVMYREWEKDKTKFIYGNLQQYTEQDGQFQITGKVKELRDFSFQLVFNPEALLPVTAMHSIECHQKAGGWKPEFDQGLEDVEYWIAAAKAGFCGKHINVTTLLYRRYSTGRHNKMRGSGKEPAMRNQIMQMHQDVYEGRCTEAAMGCGCGGGGIGTSYQSNQTKKSSKQQSFRDANLDAVSLNAKGWIEYQGKREAAFEVTGKVSGYRYTVPGLGVKFPAFRIDFPQFRLYGRGKDFNVDVGAPDGVTSTIVTQSDNAPPFEPGMPAIAAVERLDDRATEKFAEVVA